MNDYRNQQVKCDLEAAFVDSLIGQILNNKIASDNFVRILSLVMIKVDDFIRVQKQVVTNE